MDFQFNAELTADYILSKVTEEQIMAYYLRVPINNKPFKSPLRIDNHNTCSLYRNAKGKLIFKDFATGQHLDVWNVVMTKFGCTYYEALRIIANDFNILKDNSLVKNKGKVIDKNIKVEVKEETDIGVTIKDYSDAELKWWAKFGITLEILKKFRVYSCQNVFLNNNLIATTQQHSPIFGYYGNKYNGKELWKIYFPKRKTYRFIGNWLAKKLQGYDQLPKKGKLLVITKSLKDCMTLYSLNISAVAPNSETVIPSDAMIEELKDRFECIICLWDNDYTGISFLNKFRKLHPELNYTFIPRRYEAKDISDFYAKYGREKTIELIKQYLIWLHESKS